MFSLNKGGTHGYKRVSLHASARRTTFPKTITRRQFPTRQLLRLAYRFF